MNTKLFLLVSAGFFLLAPTSSLLNAATNPNDQIFVTVNPTATTQKTDEQVTRDVKDAFAADASLAPKASTVVISTRNGVVTLSGVVTTEKDKADFGSKAQTVVGSGKIVNNLTVKQEVPKTI